MKLMVCSDIHGSVKYAREIQRIFLREKADKLLILGDVYYHGPRNPLPEEYNPKGVAEIFNAMADRLIVINGNCDSEVDQMISDFTFVKSSVISVDGCVVFATHGHVYNKDNPPKGRFDAVAYGHFHKAFIEKLDGTVYFNPGSVTLPKDGIRAYAILEQGKIELRDLSGGVIAAQAVK